MSKVNRAHDDCVVAVHKETHKFFGGKAGGTHIGYSKKQYLKSAISHAKLSHDDYYYVKISFNEHGMPQLTRLEGFPNSLEKKEEDEE